MGVVIQTLKGIDSIDQVREEWISLLPEERWATFLHPDWCKSLWHSYFPNSHITLYVARQGEEVVGILPICKRKMNRYGLFLPVAEAFGGGRSDYCVPLIKKGLEPEVLPKLMDSALDATKWAGAFVWPHLPEASTVPALLEEYFADRGLTFTKDETTCPCIQLEKTAESMEKGWSSKHRKDLRRQKRRIEETYGNLSFRVVGSKQDAAGLLPGFFEMHDQRWLAIDMPGIFCDHSERRFYYSVIDHLWANGVHFSLLYCGDRIVAYGFGFVSAGYLLYYKSTYDIELQNYSPGKLYLNCLIEEGINKGWNGVDLLQGTENYKGMWSNENMKTYSYTVKTNRFLPAYYWITWGRPLAERKMGGAYRKVQARLQKLKAGVFSLWIRILRGVAYNWQEGGLRLLARKSVKKVMSAFHDKLEFLVYRLNLPGELHCPAITAIVVKEMSFERLIENRFFKAVSYPEMILARFRKGDRCFGFFIENHLAHVAWLTNDYLHLDIAAPEIKEKKTAGISDCYTLPQFRRRGAYKLAIATLIKEAAKLKKGAALIAVAPDNVASIAAIEGAGFTLDSRVVFETRLFKKSLRFEPSQKTGWKQVE